MLKPNSIKSLVYTYNNEVINCYAYTFKLLKITYCLQNRKLF